MQDQNGVSHHIKLYHPKDKIIIIVDGIKYEIIKGSKVSSLEVYCPGKEILTAHVDAYTMEIW